LDLVGIVSQISELDRIAGQTVNLMQSLDLKGELSLQHDVVVEFVPFCEGCKLWTRKFGDRAEVQAMNCDANEICN